MSKLQNFVGIDISKEWFDAALLRAQNPNDIVCCQFSQTQDGFKEFSSWLKENEIQMNDVTIFCMENTGIYNDRLVNYLLKKKALVWVEMPLKIKRSEGRMTYFFGILSPPRCQVSAAAPMPARNADRWGSVRGRSKKAKCGKTW